MSKIEMLYDEQITVEGLKYCDNFLCSLELPEISVFLIWTGSEKIAYYAFKNGKFLFSGNDFLPAPGHPIDAIENCIDLLGFLTCQPDETDEEYFKNYSADQMVWANSHECEQVMKLISDFNDKNNANYKAAVETINSYFNN